METKSSLGRTGVCRGGRQGQQRCGNDIFDHSTAYARRELRMSFMILISIQKGKIHTAGWISRIRREVCLGSGMEAMGQSGVRKWKGSEEEVR